jgi:hypothetical protein
MQHMLSERSDNVSMIGNFLIVYWGENKSQMKSCRYKQCSIIVDN